MAEPLVVNTGPLVLLARAGLLDVVGKLPLRFVCPVEVRQEIAEGVARERHTSVALSVACWTSLA